MSDVFLLGAGFSKAVCETMPLLGELSTELKKRIEIPESLQKTGDNAELWLTYLSQPQPWLSEAENLRNKALFLDMSQHIGSILGERTQGVVSETDCPDWLYNLVSWWHERKSHVITLNYDTLIERAAGLISNGKGGRLFAHDLYPVTIAEASRRNLTIFSSQSVDSLKLYKLHGSVNWFYSGMSANFGETIYFADLLEWGGTGDHEQRSLKAITDKVPLIAPPTSEKITYFQHETMRRLWSLAGEALGEAGRLICIGYSFPISDLSIRFFLAGNRSSKKIPVIIVNVLNFDPTIEARYQELVGSSYEVQHPFTGPDAVRQFVATLG